MENFTAVNQNRNGFIGYMGFGELSVYVSVLERMAIDLLNK